MCLIKMKAYVQCSSVNEVTVSLGFINDINVVYKIPCSECPWSYVGETGRCFETRKKEHVRNVKSYAGGSNIVKHA